MTFKAVKEEGGTRKVEVTGGVREVIPGKGRFDLLPPYPILRLAQHYENGAKKYADRNWEKGLPLNRFYESGLRHYFQFMGGDRSEDHLAAILWNIAGYLHTEKKILDGELPKSLWTVPWGPSIPGKGLDDIPDAAMAPKVLRKARRSTSPGAGLRRPKSGRRQADKE